MSHDDEWLTTLLRRWRALPPEVHGQLQDYLHLSPGDRKNQRRLEKILKVAAGRQKTFHHDADGRHAQS